MGPGWDKLEQKLLGEQLFWSIDIPSPQFNYTRTRACQIGKQMGQLLLAVAGSKLDLRPGLWKAENEIRKLLCKLGHERQKKLELMSQLQEVKKERTHPKVLWEIR